MWKLKHNIFFFQNNTWSTSTMTVPSIHIDFWYSSKPLEMELMNQVWHESLEEPRKICVQFLNHLMIQEKQLIKVESKHTFQLLSFIWFVIFWLFSFKHLLQGCKDPSTNFSLTFVSFFFLNFKWLTSFVSFVFINFKFLLLSPLLIENPTHHTSHEFVLNFF